MFHGSQNSSPQLIFLDCLTDVYPGRLRLVTWFAEESPFQLDDFPIKNGPLPGLRVPQCGSAFSLLMKIPKNATALEMPGSLMLISKDVGLLQHSSSWSWANNGK